MRLGFILSGYGGFWMLGYLEFRLFDCVIKGGLSRGLCLRRLVWRYFRGYILEYREVSEGKIG